MGECLSQQDFAKLLGKDKSYVTRLKQAGRLVMTEAGLVDVDKSLELIKSTSDPARADNGQNSPPKSAVSNDLKNEAVGSSYQTSRAIKARYEALAAKQDYEKSSGQLIERGKVEVALADVVSFARQSIENLPMQVAASLVGKDFDAIVSIIKTEIIQMMGETHREAEKQFNRLTEVAKK